VYSYAVTQTENNNIFYTCKYRVEKHVYYCPTAPEHQHKHDQYNNNIKDFY